MAKGPIITPEVEVLIATVYQKHPKWKAKEVCNWVRGDLKKKDPNLRDDWPSLSTVQKVLATYRKNKSKFPEDPLERPWSMATLDDYPIPPEAILSVLEVWKFRIEKGDILTIREAKWVARLSGVLKTIEDISYEAFEYARFELMFQLLNRPFDSTYLDRELMGLPPPELLVWQGLVAASFHPSILRWSSKEMFMKEVEQLRDRARKEEAEGLRDWIRKVEQKEAQNERLRQGKEEIDKLVDKVEILKLEKSLADAEVEKIEKAILCQEKEANHERSHSQQRQT